MRKHRKLKAALFASVIAISHAGLAQDADFQLIDSYGDWYLFESRYDSGAFDSCWLIREFSGGDSMELYLSPEISAISFSNDAWTFAENDSYAVDYRFDDGPAIQSSLFAISDGSSIYLGEPLETITNDLKSASNFYVVAEFVTLSFDLADSGAAVGAVEDCLARNMAGIASNPFEGGGDDQNTDPVAGDGGALAVPPFSAKTAWEMEPRLTLEDFNGLFDEIRSFDITVTGQYSDFPWGRYMAEIEDVVMAFYWEEDPAERTSETVYADAMANVTADCTNFADTLAQNEAGPVVHAVRGQIGCQLEEGELYLRMSLLDLSSLGVIMVFLADPVDAEFVDVLEEMVVTGLVAALKAEGAGQN